MIVSITVQPDHIYQQLSFLNGLPRNHKGKTALGFHRDDFTAFFGV